MVFGIHPDSMDPGKKGDSMIEFNEAYFEKINDLTNRTRACIDLHEFGIYTLCEIMSGILQAMIRQNEELRSLSAAVAKQAREQDDLEMDIADRWHMLFKTLVEIGSRLPEADDPERVKFFKDVTSPIKVE